MKGYPLPFPLILEVTIDCTRGIFHSLQAVGVGEVSQRWAGLEWGAHVSGQDPRRPCKGRCVDILHKVIETHTHTLKKSTTSYLGYLLHSVLIVSATDLINASLELWSINGMKLLWWQCMWKFHIVAILPSNYNSYNSLQSVWQDTGVHLVEREVKEGSEVSRQLLALMQTHLHLLCHGSCVRQKVIVWDLQCVKKKENVIL